MGLMSPSTVRGGLGAVRPQVRSQKPRDVETARPAVFERSSVYRGATHEAAEAAYHADASTMARMGYAPTAEDWKIVMEQVLTVRYVHAPERAPAVLTAIAQVEAESALANPHPAPERPSRLDRAAGWFESVPPDVRLTITSSTGIAAGIGFGLLVGWVAGQIDLVGLVGFGFIGLLLGALTGLPRYARRTARRSVPDLGPAALDAPKRATRARSPRGGRKRQAAADPDSDGHVSAGVRDVSPMASGGAPHSA